MPPGALTVYAQWRKTTPDTVVFDPNNINGKTLAAKSLTVYSGSAPWETFEVVVKSLPGHNVLPVQSDCPAAASPPALPALTSSRSSEDPYLYRRRGRPEHPVYEL